MVLIKQTWRSVVEFLRPRAGGGDLVGRPNLMRRVASAAAPGRVAAAIDGLFGRSDAPRRSGVDSATYFQTLSLAIGDLVMEHDWDGRVVSIGGDADVSQHFQIDAEDLMGTGFFDRIHVADRPQFLRAFDCARDGGETASAIVRLRTGASERSAKGFDEPIFSWAEIRVRRLVAEAPQADARRRGALISVTRDVSDVMEIRERLECARADAALAVSLKDRLLANVSHELRTPLNAILGFSEMLGDARLAPTEPAKRLEYAHIIHSSAQHLLSVVNLVLDMSKIEAGKFEISPEPFVLESLVKDCCDMLSLKASNGGIALVREESDFLLEIVADKRACRQILLNLLSNAVKFTPPGGSVSIGASVVNSVIHIHVADSGIGIAPQDLPHLGEPFFQVRSGYDRSHEGAGLGLSLVRGLVGLHGGALWLESSPGVGTRVTVRLPLDCRSTPRAESATSRLETFALTGSDLPACDVFDANFGPAERRIA